MSWTDNYPNQEKGRLRENLTYQPCSYPNLQFLGFPFQANLSQILFSYIRLCNYAIQNDNKNNHFYNYKVVSVQQKVSIFFKLLQNQPNKKLKKISTFNYFMQLTHRNTLKVHAISYSSTSQGKWYLNYYHALNC